MSSTSVHKSLPPVSIKVQLYPVILENDTTSLILAHVKCAGAKG